MTGNISSKTNSIPFNTGRDSDDSEVASLLILYSRRTHSVISITVGKTGFMHNSRYLD